MLQRDNKMRNQQSFVQCAMELGQLFGRYDMMRMFEALTPKDKEDKDSIVQKNAPMAKDEDCKHNDTIGLQSIERLDDAMCLSFYEPTTRKRRPDCIEPTLSKRFKVTNM
jgi:hypothetical protein